MRPKEGKVYMHFNYEPVFIITCVVARPTFFLNPDHDILPVVAAVPADWAFQRLDNVDTIE